MLDGASNGRLNAGSNTTSRPSVAHLLEQLGIDPMLPGSEHRLKALLKHRALP